MDIYFFSNHTPDPQMIKDLGAPIKTQFRGSISDIHAQGEQILFTETIHIGGQTLKQCSKISQDATGAAVGVQPIVLNLSLNN